VSIWFAILAGSLGCYALKLVGMSVPPSWFASRRMEQVVTIVPIAVLAALVGSQTFATGRHLTLDPRALGLAVAALLVKLRAPFLVVVVAATVTTALGRKYL
jgi:uncharacterized membrane protein